jgi:hypothetical protein
LPPELGEPAAGEGQRQRVDHGGAARGRLVAREIGRRREPEQRAPEQERFQDQLADVPFGQDLERAFEQQADRPRPGRVATNVEVANQAADVEREQVAEPVAAAADDAIPARGGAAEAA